MFKNRLSNEKYFRFKDFWDGWQIVNVIFHDISLSIPFKQPNMYFKLLDLNDDRGHTLLLHVFHKLVHMKLWSRLFITATKKRNQGVQMLLVCEILDANQAGLGSIAIRVIRSIYLQIYMFIYFFFDLYLYIYRCVSISLNIYHN